MFALPTFGLIACKATPNFDGSRYLALGDSYTIGQSVDTSELWPVQLTKELQLAVPGDMIRLEDFMRLTTCTHHWVIDAADVQTGVGAYVGHPKLFSPESFRSENMCCCSGVPIDNPISDTRAEFSE